MYRKNKFRIWNRSVSMSRSWSWSGNRVSLSRSRIVSRIPSGNWSRSGDWSRSRSGSRILIGG